jgi:hypothetical protein
MQSIQFFKAFLFTLITVTIFTLCWEYYWRSRGFTVSYNDDKILWADKRKNIYKPADRATVFIGGSRIKFDLDIPTWKNITGEDAVQLALVGTPSRLILRDLANDTAFKGKLVIDVAEAQFFTTDTIRRDKPAREALEYYRKETPAQKASARIDYTLESSIVFLEEGKYGLNALLNDLQIPNRAGVMVPSIMPKEFSQTTFDRQNFLTPMFLARSALQKKQMEIWKKGIAIAKKTPPIKGDMLNAFLQDLKNSIDRIRSRGGTVLFVRPPSDGELVRTENEVYPRKDYWDKLLAYTNTPGIYFSDYAPTAALNLPEHSHLSPNDAVVYTKNLIMILQQDKGWIFSASPNRISAQLQHK